MQRNNFDTYEAKQRYKRHSHKEQRTYIAEHADDTLLALNGSPKSPLNHYKP